MDEAGNIYDTQFRLIGKADEDEDDPKKNEGLLSSDYDDDFEL